MADIPVPLADMSTDISQADTTGSVRAYLKITYKTKGITPEEYLLTNVSGNYSILDHQVRVTGAKISYGCNGFFPSYVSNQMATDISVSNPFDKRTGFSKYVIEDFSSTIGCYYTLDLARGTSNKWKFTIENYISGSLT